MSAEHSFADRLRLAFGLRWRAARPGLREIAPALRTAALAAFLLLAWGVAGRLDYEIAHAAEQEARAALAEERAAGLAALAEERAAGLAGRADVADRMEIRAELTAREVARLEDYMLACLNGNRHWVLGGERWECKARPVGPYQAKED